MVQDQQETSKKSMTFTLLFIGMVIILSLNVILSAIQSVLQQNQGALTQITRIASRIELLDQHNQDLFLSQQGSIQQVLHLFQTSSYLQRAKDLVPDIQQGYRRLTTLTERDELSRVGHNQSIDPRSYQVAMDSLLRGMVFISNQGNQALGTLSGLISLFAFLLLGSLIILTGWLELEIIERNWDKRTAKQIVEREEILRQMVASELHDDIAQTLALAKIKASPEVGVLIGNTITSIRNLTRSLSLPKLDSTHLTSSLEELVQHYRSAADFQLQFSISGDLTNLNDQTMAIHMYRIVQELLQNALKHSNAQTLSLTIHRGKEIITIRYRDDGKGMDPSILTLHSSTTIKQQSIPGKHLGLKNIQDRINLMNGKISITSKEYRGVMIDLDIPL